MPHNPLLKIALLIATFSLSGCLGGVDGQPYDEQRRCWLPSEYAGWNPDVMQGCDTAIEFAEDGDGRVWMFSSTGCLPFGFETVEDRARLDEAFDSFNCPSE